MKELVVLSGKGGTGKTSIVGSFAVLAENKVMADCDVDAADLHLLLDPKIKEESSFTGGVKAIIDEDKCTGCGLCADICRFDAISRKDLIDDNSVYFVDEISCEGCRFCEMVCPVSVILMEEKLSGKMFVSETRYGPLVHARLGVAQENSGKLVSEVRNKAREIAEAENREYILTDGPPGIGCPVISSISGADFTLIVTEPTLSGMHDLERVIGVLKHFKLRGAVCINKYDINQENTDKIERIACEEGFEVISRIPYDDTFTEAMVAGVPVVEFSSGKLSNYIEKLWERIINML